MPAADEFRSRGGTGAVPNRVLSTLLGLVLPVLGILSACAVALAWRGALPDPVASHWSSGGVDRTTPLTTLVLIVAGIALLCSVGGWAIAFFIGREAVTRRTGVAFSVGLAVFLCSMMLGTLWIQRGLTVATDAPSAGWVVAGSLVAGGLTAAMAALAMPPDLPVIGAVRTGRAVTRRQDPRLPWVREVRSRENTWLSSVSVIGILVVGLLTGSLLVLLPAAAVAGLIMFALARVTVTIDADGLQARGLLGWPRVHVPAEEILEVHATWVSPVREFGGLGYRIGGGDEIGLVVRSGEGLSLTRTGLRPVCVSVDDAPLAAELLRGVARAALGTDSPQDPG